MSVPLARFAQLVSREQFGLAEACLLVAQDAYPDLDVEAHLRALDDIAAGVQRHLGGERTVEQRIAALNRHLYAELGFKGNADAYYDPRNSYLNDVLARRTGIPITLSVVYLEVARRIGVSMQGVAFPGHFLVKLRARRGQLVLDPFAGGEPQSEDDLRERLEQVLPRPLDPDAPIDPYLEAASPRQIVARVLRNLKAIHLGADQPQRALDVLNRLLLVAPEATTELRDRGLVYARLECFRPALSDLQSYLRRVPDAPDAAAVHEKIIALRERVAQMQ
jgi:regulator of sirC expression with transglutaminase-like and TPR domain